ncbi:MAG: hypothetical protein M5U01_11275 [Ardenticatenaceae bacterium]|nr:hypothetical protein [Ardenticatenaceae bacterium]
MAQPEAMLPTRVHAVNLARVRRERMLPAPGTVHVRLGQEVGPDSLIAEGERPGSVHVVELAPTLGLDRRQVEAALLVQPGEAVTVNQPLAARKRLLRRREVLAPVAGQVLAIDEHGRLLIASTPGPVKIAAGTPGRVVNIMPRFGAVVESNGAFFQGIWGSGGESFGVLRVLVGEPDTMLQPEHIDIAVRGTIVVGGATITREGLEAARAAQVRGLILGAMPYGLVDLVRTLPFPVILTEGFGSIPIAMPLFGGLAAVDGREAMLDGRYQARWGRRLPELFVPLGQPGQPLRELGPLAEAQQVRLAAPPLLGRIGSIVRLDAGRRSTESGLPLAGCEVELDSGEVVFVPYSNLEQLG